MPSLPDLQHLLRRTEFVARGYRVQELLPLSIEAAVDNVLQPTGTPPCVLNETNTWLQAVEYTKFWLHQMAHVSSRPIHEKMAFFWHGHFVSSMTKANGVQMRDQVDLYRSMALGNLREIAKRMATTPAMLLYLDNATNVNVSRNENFGRELLELFLLGVGNYNEVDVQSSAAAWTGHSVNGATGAYMWWAPWHDPAPKPFLGRMINQIPDSFSHGFEVIETILGNGVVPGDAARAENRGRPSREVAAEFLSTKLWREFAGTEPSPDVVAALRNAALNTNFEIRPWLRTLLLRPEFYSEEVRFGRVRSPVEYVVAMLVATGLEGWNAPWWVMEGMGQHPLFPPNVAGWKHNGYYVNASSFGQRIEAASAVEWKALTGFWNGAPMRLKNRSFTQAEIGDLFAQGPEVLILAFADAMEIQPSERTVAVLRDFIKNRPPTEAWAAVMMMFLTPEFQLA